MTAAGGFQKGASLPLFSSPGPGSRKTVFYPLKEGDCLPLWVTLEEWCYYPVVSTIFPDTSTGVPFLTVPLRVSFSLHRWPVDTGARLLFTTRCIVTPFDLLLFEPDAVL